MLRAKDERIAELEAVEALDEQVRAAPVPELADVVELDVVRQ